ncbi:MAG: DUF3826 domain-containing protein [Chitinophagaceae bacterium]
MIKRIQQALLLTALFIAPAGYGQAPDSIKIKADEATLKANAEADKKAGEWVAALQLSDEAKEKRVSEAIATHLKLIRDWNNSHPFTTVPAGINPATGNKLSDLDRQVIANSAMPVTIHQDLMKALQSDLTAAQVEAILDQYTIGKVAFTLKGYKAIVPDLTTEEETKITAYLKQAREQAIDYKNMTQVSAIFEIYKTKCEQYLNSNGRSWKQLYKAYVDKVKAQKEAEKQSKKTN